jgi:preprotein translocase subunit SecA
MLKVISKFIDLNKRELDRLEKEVAKVNKFGDEYKKLKDADFTKKTKEFRERLEKGESLNDILPQAYALVREAGWRTIGLRAYDVQLMAAIALFEGKVAEQKTGEGKTLSAVFPLYLHALRGKGAHLVTVNDYLARIGAGWNAPIYHLLGVSVGVIAQEQVSYVYDPQYSDRSHGDERLENLKPASRKEAYATDITYGTNNEFGFDYLRDNMRMSIEEIVQREHYFAIVDEVDSVLIDEARTPLIISAPDTDPTDKYYKFAELIKNLNPDTDYVIDEKARSANLTEHGITKVEKITGVDNLYEKDFEAIHHIENALKARALYHRDQQYVVKDGEVIIVDEFTGRLMPGRRWSEGLHQAVEAKEGVSIQQESKTLATISFQNYFRMYKVLSGMTGTAATEAAEFKKIYDLDVVVVSTHHPIIRDDRADQIYKTKRAKYGAVVAEIEKSYTKGQPVLVGTTSIEQNEIVGKFLKRKKIPHNILNAKNHEREASIIADAGKPGGVTVATNMAGRGVDIVLGGAMPERPEGITTEKYQSSKEYKEWQKLHDKVIKAGGLHVIGTERHESRRIDNQLRGRSGRQGDPGSTRFYLSLEDDLMRIFGGEQISSIMDKLKLPEDQPIENKLISRAIEQAQVKVEGYNFDLRKSVVEYDDVANQQRDIVYKLRRRVLGSDDLKEEVQQKLEAQIEQIILISWPDYVETGNPEFDSEKAIAGVLEIIPFDEASRQQLKKNLEGIKDKVKVKEFLTDLINKTYEAREKELSEDIMRKIEKFAYLGAIDELWIDHIDYIDDLSRAIRLRAYGQRDPLVEYKNEAYDLFERLLERIDDELCRRIFRIGVARPTHEIPLEQARINEDETDMIGLAQQNADETAATGEPAFAQAGEPAMIGSSTSKLADASQGGKQQRKRKKLGRNDPCWCGSGKKWKKCHYPQEG